MGVGTILEAKEIVLMATGTGKSDAVKAAIEGFSLVSENEKRRIYSCPILLL